MLTHRIIISYYVTICTFAIAHTSSASIYEYVRMPSYQYAYAMLIHAYERIVISYCVTFSTQNGLHAYSHKGFDYIKKPLFKH